MSNEPILVSAAMDGTIRFWDTATQKNTLESQVNNLCITPDGNQLAVGAWQNLRMYSLKEPTAHGLHTFNVHNQKNVTAVGFQADGKWMYTGGEDGMAKIWDMRATQLNCQRIFQVITPVHSVALHPNQVELIVADSAGALYVWDLRTDRDDSLITEVDMSEYIVHVDIDRAGRQCAAVTNRGHLFMWNISHNGMLSPSLTPSNFLPTTPFGFTPPSTNTTNNTTLAPNSADINENCESIDLEFSQQKTQLIEESQLCDFVTFGAEPCSLENAGSLPPLVPASFPPLALNVPVISATSNAHLMQQQTEGLNDENNFDEQLLLQTTNNEHQTEFLQQQQFFYPGQQMPAGFFPSHTTAATAVGLGGVPTAPLLRPCVKIAAHSTFTLKCRFRPDGLAVATTSADQTTKLWSITNHKLLNSYSMPGNKWVWESAFTNDSKYMITATSDGIMRMWDLATSEIVRTFQSHSLGITAMAFRDCA